MLNGGSMVTQEKLKGFAELLKGVRISKRMSQEKLADVLELSQTTISALECAQLAPSRDILQKLSTFFTDHSDQFYFEAGYLPPDLSEALIESQITWAPIRKFISKIKEKENESNQ